MASYRSEDGIVKVLIDADMPAHEVGHLRITEKDEDGNVIIDHDTGRPVKGDLIPVDRAIEVAKGRVLSIIMGSQSGGWKAFLSKGKTFRDGIATILPYKGNREHSPRDNVDACKEAIHRDLGAIWCRGIEADDALATEQWSDLIDVGSKHGWNDDVLQANSNTVIASRDKDLDTVPGWKYSWWLKGGKDRDGNEISEERRTVEKGEAYWVSIVEAFRNFYKQLLMGDTADNIKGLYNVGAKHTWLKQLDSMDEEEDMYEHVEDKYVKYFGPNYGIKFLKETARLLHMQRRKDDEWLPPHERDEHYWYL